MNLPFPKLPLGKISLFFGLGLLAWLAFREGGWLQETEATEVLGQQVQRGPLRITVSQRGNL